MFVVFGDVLKSNLCEYFVTTHAQHNIQANRDASYTISWQLVVLVIVNGTIRD